jgi:ABC-type polysaccharide/polyol phosphate export permease
MSEKRKDAALWSLVFVVIVQFAGVCFWLGSLNTEVRNLKQTTEVLLRLQLEKSQRGAR